MFVCKHELPKCWLGRIQKYWDKLIPSDYPVSSSSFSTTFSSEVVANAVSVMEEKINSEECIALKFIPENTFVSSYVGVYNVEGTPGELTLLSPEKVSSDKVIALHFSEEDETWQNIDEIQVIDGYVWGTLDSFSPIAIFEYKNDIVFTDGPVAGVSDDCKVVVANGNNIKVYEKDGKLFVQGPSNISTEITEKIQIVGGSIDGTPINSTNVSVIGIKETNFLQKICGGSILDSTDDNPIFTTVDNINIRVINSKINIVTGSIGAVRTNNVTITIENSDINAVGIAQSYIENHDINNIDNLGFGCNSWVKESNILVSGSKINILFSAGNSGYLYTKDTCTVVDSSEIEYFIVGGGSNGRTDNNSSVIINSNINVLQTVNRGTVGTIFAKIDKCKIENLYVGGDSTDNTVSGYTESVRYTIGSGIYNIVPGTDGGNIISRNDIVRSIKVSRSANVTISDDFISVLGNKYVIK